MKILFLATSEIAIDVLHTLNEKFKIVAVVTQTDKPVKRNKMPVPTPIAIEAEKLKLKVYKAEIISPDLLEELKKLKPDIFVTFAYGVILKKDFLEMFPLGGINIHPSLLPEFRGASPIQSAILQGKNKSGITIQKVVLKVDAGDILLQKEFEITENDDAITIENLVKKESCSLITEVLLNFDKINPIKQDESKATYCKILKKEDGLIDWENESGIQIFNKIRAFVKWPIAHTYLDGKILNIYKATIKKDVDFNLFKQYKNGQIVVADIKKGLFIKTKDCILNLDMLQLEGKKILNYKDFINGQRFIEKKIFTKGEGN